MLNKKSPAWILLLFTLILVNCTDPNAEVIKLENEVIEIHDEVMPKMSDIHKLKKELKELKLKGSDSTQILELMLSLDQADEAMMAWMDQYKSPDLTKPSNQNIIYLQDQRSKMIEVKNQMLDAIKQAQNRLDQ